LARLFAGLFAAFFFACLRFAGFLIAGFFLAGAFFAGFGAAVAARAGNTNRYSACCCCSKTKLSEFSRHAVKMGYW
jgi:hypothetical protein